MVGKGGQQIFQLPTLRLHNVNGIPHSTCEFISLPDVVSNCIIENVWYNYEQVNTWKQQGENHDAFYIVWMSYSQWPIDF